MNLNLIAEFTLSPRAVGGAALDGSHQRGGEGRVLPSLHRCAAQGSRLPHQVQRPTAAILKCRGQGFCTRSAELNCWVQPFWEEEFWSEASAAAPCVQVKLDEAQRKNKRLDFILLLRLYCCFPGIVSELCW